MTITRTCEAIRIDRICIDNDVRARVGLDRGAIAHYASLLSAGTVLPPILVVADPDSNLWLVDGSHRLEAHRALDRATLVAEIRIGSRDDAIWISCTANQCHGLRRSNADKHRSVVRALSSPRGVRLSNRQIARHCGVHHHSVGRIRHELESSGAIRQINRRLAERNGVVYEHETESIASSNAARSVRGCTSERSPENLVALAPPPGQAVCATLVTSNTESSPGVGSGELRSTGRSIALVASEVFAAYAQPTPAVDGMLVEACRHLERALSALARLQTKPPRIALDDLGQRSSSASDLATIARLAREIDDLSSVLCQAAGRCAAALSETGQELHG